MIKTSIPPLDNYWRGRPWSFKRKGGLQQVSLFLLKIKLCCTAVMRRGNDGKSSEHSGGIIRMKIHIQLIFNQRSRRGGHQWSGNWFLGDAIIPSISLLPWWWPANRMNHKPIALYSELANTSSYISRIDPYRSVGHPTAGLHLIRIQSWCNIIIIVFWSHTNKENSFKYPRIPVLLQREGHRHLSGNVTCPSFRMIKKNDIKYITTRSKGIQWDSHTQEKKSIIKTLRIELYCSALSHSIRRGWISMSSGTTPLSLSLCIYVSRAVPAAINHARLLVHCTKNKGARTLSNRYT